MFRQLATFFGAVVNHVRTSAAEDEQLAGDVASAVPPQTPEDVAIAHFDAGVDQMVRTNRELE